MHFWQRAPRFAGIRLGFSEHTIGSQGCLLCVVAEILAYVLGTDPARLNRWLARHGGFVDGCRFVFRAVEPLGLRLVQVVDCLSTPAPMDMVGQALGRGEFVLAMVDFAPSMRKLQQHWVRILSCDEDDCVISDPWLECGEISLMARYALPSWDDPSRAIFRLAVYSVDREVPVSMAVASVGQVGDAEVGPVQDRWWPVGD
jgi:hypothetical protein